MSKKIKKTTQEQEQLIARLCLMDDTFFETFAQDPDAVEELLQTFLETPKLKIKKETLVPQKSIHVVGKRSIRVDAYMEGHEDHVFNIEIQKYDNENHVKRVRYNSSLITVNASEPGDTFGDVQNVCVIYISQKDVLKNGRTISHAEMTCRETGEPVHDGLLEIYVNATHKDGTIISELMDVFTDPDPKNTRFPKTEQRIQKIKHDPEEVQGMCQLVEEYANNKAKKAVAKVAAKAEKRAKEAAIIATIEELREFNVSPSDISQRLQVKYKMSAADAVAYVCIV